MKRYKNSFLYLFSVVLFFSCSQADPYFPEEGEIDEKENEEVICEGDTEVGVVPSSFKKKLLIEEVTGAWCQWCPVAIGAMEEVLKGAKEDDNIYGMAIHFDDAMTTPHTAFFSDLMSVTGYPSCYLNRKESLPANTNISHEDNMASWNTIIDAELAKTADMGLAIETSYTNDKKSANIKVHLSSTGNLSGTYRLHVQLYEDNISGSGSGFTQQNALNSLELFKGSPFYSLEGKITGYEHQHVFRGAITTSLGEEVEGADFSSKTDLQKEYTIDVENDFLTDDLKQAPISNQTYILAFVSNNDGTEIYNVQKVKLGCTKDWN